MGLIRNARILMALNPYMNQLGKEFQMKFSTHTVIQILATIASGAVAVSGVIPPKYSWVVSGGISLIQAIIALLNHGSPATPTTPTSSTNPIVPGGEA